MGYWKWNLFDYVEAYDTLKDLERENCELSHIFSDVKKFENNLSFLKACISDNKEISYSYILVDLILNAQRLYEIGRYDDAVARLYRALEMVAQLELLKYGYEDPVPAKGIKEEHKRIFEKYGSPGNDGMYKLGLHKKMEVLRDLGSTVGNSFVYDERVKIILQYRNNSFLAHGFVPVKKNMVENMLQIVEKYVKMSLKEIKGVKFDEIKNRGKFPRLLWGVA